MVEKMKQALQRLKKQYRRSNVHSRNLLVLLGFIAVGFAVFFTSYQWMPKAKSGTRLTAVDTVVEYDKRKITIKRWQYCAAEKSMEIELEIENDAYDGLDTYSYALRTSNGSAITDCPVSVIIADPTMAVVQAHNIPAQFLDAALYMMVSDPNADRDYLTMYTNNTAVEPIDTLPVLTKADYTRNRLEREIIAAHKAIDANNETMLEMQDKIKKLNDTITQLQDNKTYQTEEEIRSTDEKISNHVLTIQDITKQMYELQDQNNLLNQKIEKLKAAKEAIKD